MKNKLFYSYCHSDSEYRDNMEKSLKVLKSNGLIDEWHDRKIIPGSKWKEAIDKELEKADFIIFLISSDFLASEACLYELKKAKELALQSPKELICVIVRPCAWLDYDDLSDYLALPTDGDPVSTCTDADTAWLDVYTGVKIAIEEFMKNHEVNEQYIKNLGEFEFCSQNESKPTLGELFVFPRLELETKNIDKEIYVKSAESLFEQKKSLIIGEEQSGKTKLCAYLYLELIKSDASVLHIDLLDIVHKKARENVILNCFKEQYSGDFDNWLKSDNKTIILDNLTHSKNALDYVLLLEEMFENIIISISTDNYEAYFRDEPKIADYKINMLKPFTLAKQESLIKKWLELKRNDEEILHGKIDQIENSINEIIISNKILPRYPFFILSILQTHEAFMPQDIKITAYGHCYYALIVAHLVKNGIDKEDSAISQCFNFSSHFAYELYIKGGAPCLNRNDFDVFCNRYKEKYVIKDSILNRMMLNNGLFKQNENNYTCFNLPYSYYFFLGKYLAENHKENNELIAGLVEKSYFGNNALIIIFIIHHAQELNIIEEILTHTVCALDSLQPARLDESETKVMLDLIKTMPVKIISNRSVEEERSREREFKEAQSENKERISINSSEKEYQKQLDEIYLANKNIEILSQILKNKFGNLEKTMVKQILEIICDAGLRLVKVLLLDEKQFTETINYIYRQIELDDKVDVHNKDVVFKELKKTILIKMFMWTMGMIEKVVSSINKREIQDLIFELKEEKNTPAYELIYYFYTLDSSLSFNLRKKEILKGFLEKYAEKDMLFFRKILSIRTQHYFNTHRVEESIKQSTSSLLGISNKPKRIK